MGVDAAPAMCRLALAMGEHIAVTTLGPGSWGAGISLVRGIRYVDDARIFALCDSNILIEDADEVLRAYTVAAWPAEMIWKPDNVCPKVGTHVDWDGRQIRWY